MENPDGDDDEEEGGQSSRKVLGKVAGDRTSSGKSGSANKSARAENIVEQCARAYAENPRPRRLGKMLAFWYNGKN